MGFLKSWSFKAKLFGAFFLICTLFTLTSLLIFQNLMSSSRKAALAQFKANASALNYAIGAQFFERYGDVQAFALNPDLVSGSTSTRQAALDNYVALYGIYDVIVLVSPEGELLASNSQTAKGVKLNGAALKSLNYKNFKWFQNALSENWSKDQAKGFNGTYFEGPENNPVADTALGSQQLTTVFSTLVKNSSGKVVGVLSTHANFIWVELEAKNLYQQLKSQGLESSEITMLNKEGQVILDYDPSRVGSDEVQRDFSVLLKFNLAQTGHEGAKQMIAGQKGALFIEHIRKKVMQAAGFEPVDNPKFITSHGWGVMVREDESEVLAELIAAQRVFYVVLVVVFVLALVLGFLFSKQIYESIGQIIKELSSSFAKISSSSQSVSTAATQLASASTETASAVEETTTTLAGVNGRVEDNVRVAESSAKMGDEMAGSAQDGRRKMGDLNNAMSEILSTNDKIEEIATLIKKISDRTTVIGDIAAQTKILSFNASIEAERAGENGKGFAVVAQEVGKLAQTSVKAAVEISEIVSSSVEEAQKIVHINKEKVVTALQKLEEANAILNKFNEQAQSMSQNSREILSGSREQSLAVSEVNKAMKNINAATQETADAAENIASVGEELSSQAHLFSKSVHSLESLINGQSA